MRRGDRRLGEPWSRGQRVFNGLLRALFRAALILADALPPRWLVALGGALGAGAALLWGGGAHRAAAALRAAGLDRPRVGEVFRAAGENLARCLLLRRTGLPAQSLATLDPEARAAIEAATSEGRGVLLLGCHQGPFEVAGALLAELGFAPLVLVRESYDPALDPVVDAHRVARGLDLVHRGAPDSARRLLRGLRAGRMVAVLADLPSRVPSVPIERLGTRLAVPTGPARLAALTGCAVLVGGLVRRGTGFRLTLRRVPVTGNAASDTAAWHGVLEQVIGASPVDYPWMALPASAPEASPAATELVWR